MNRRQAYLIMAHNQPELLKILIRSLDYEYNDIYVHVDQRNIDINEKEIRNCVYKSNIYFISPRMKVRWGTFDIVECELRLIKYALNHGEYLYLHLMSGTDMLLDSCRNINAFFEHAYPTEFVQFQEKEISERYIKKVNKYHFFIRKNPNLIQKFFHKLLILLQPGIDRCKKNGVIYQKGAMWYSITGKFALYTIEKEKTIRKLFRNTAFCDEMFIQTILINSEFRKNIVQNNFTDNYENIMYCIDWDRGTPYEYTMDDYEELIESKMFFARKFNYEKDKDIVLKLAERLK